MNEEEQKRLDILVNDCINNGWTWVKNGDVELLAPPKNDERYYWCAVYKKWKENKLIPSYADPQEPPRL